jgi:hypothetical protein
MANHSKDRGMGLMQSGPAPQDLIGIFKRKLADPQTPAMEKAACKRDVRRKSAATWTLGAVAILSLMGANYLYQAHKDVLFSSLRLESVPTLPSPRKGLGIDEQALYWTYALYDIASFRKRFGITGYYAVNQAEARRNLEKILPDVSTSALGEISTYAPVAFQTLPTGGRP